ncbi:MAG TPA: DUF4383 domain-containing protein [Candidatus Paceibacterota bacterium]|jgi:hypothetical protein|nr:DUF4383 domain-containing protein [Candidatus Paceibacterota bacterium]
MAKTALWVFGVVFVVVGLLGWVSNPIVGANGIFMTNHLHDAVHALIGIIFILVALFAAQSATMTLKIVGVVYLLLAVLGFIMVPNGGDLLGLVTTNMADHWLHVVLGVVILAVGFLAPKGSPMSMEAPM